MALKIDCFFTVVLLIISSSQILAQNVADEKERQTEQILESLGESEDGESGNSQALEDLIKYSENPLPVNTATAEELEQLHLLDFRQIRDILEYRNQYGFIFSKYELNTLKSLTPGLIASLEPFLLFDQPDQIQKRRKTDQKVILRAKTSLPFSKGYFGTDASKPAAYPGIPVSLYARYQLEIPGKLELGLMSDKDAGEDLFKGSNPEGFDFYSGYLSWKSKSLIRQITVGDYNLKFGQGLNFWSGSAIGKSTNVVNILKTGQGIQPYTSADENRYFRGVATVLGAGPVKLMLFFSGKNRDANLSVDKQTDETVFTSLKTGGYHRTKAEVEDEKTVSEQDLGGYAEVRLKNFRLGGLWCEQQFGRNMINGLAKYKEKSFSGNQNRNMGLDYQLAFNRIQLFGEAALSMNQKPAFIQGMIWHTHPRLNLSVYYRYMDPGFHSFYGNPFQEGSEARNERGLYSGVEIYPLRRVKITAYGDFYHFPWLTYSTLAPSSGRDYLLQCEFSLSKQFFFYLKGKFEIKPQKYTQGPADPADHDESLSKYRFHSELQVSDRFSIKHRFEGVHYSFDNRLENGFLVYQDLEFSLFRSLNIWLRYTWFKTDGYNSRIYAYENDLIYSFSFPEFHGKGNRLYLNMRWQPSKELTLYLKAGRTLHSGVNSWGSGNDLTMGNFRTDLKGEIYFRF